MSSTSAYPLLARLVAAAVNVSQKSARILREIKKSGELNVQEKAANDYVTKADFQSQLNIIKSLESMFPKIKFCGEEGDLKEDYNDLVTTMNEEVLQRSQKLPETYNTMKEEELLIWVDPLDGTREYTEGPEVSHEVTVLIGVSWNGKPIAGVINQPFFKPPAQMASSELGRVLWGIVGLGAFDSIKGQLSAPVKSAGETPRVRKIITTRSHMTDIIKRDLTSIPNSQLIHAGGAGHKVLAVIEGLADSYIYPRDGTKRWDTCAPEAILRSLGGQLTDVLGNDYSYATNENNIVENCYGLIASIDTDHSLYVNQISDELKRNVLDEAIKLIEKKKNEKASQ